MQIKDYVGDLSQQWIFEEANYGSGGTYRSVSSSSPDCFGYTMFRSYKLNLNITSSSKNTVDHKDAIEKALNKYTTNYRLINSYNSYIEADEYRIAFRVPNGHYNPNTGYSYYFHVIYQLGDGTWAGKNFEDPSKHFGDGNPSIIPEMWDGDGQYPQSCGTIYYAVKVSELRG